jgi:hypothetical protein
LTDVSAAPAPSDVGADLTAAFDAAEPDSSPAPAPADSASPSTGKSSPSAPSSPGATAGGDAGPARGADGKFTPRDPNAAPAAPQDPKAPPAPVAPEFKVPEKWPADVRAKFEALHKVSPEHAQFALDQFNLARSQFAEVEKAKGSLASRAKILDSVESLLAPNRQQRALQGVDDAAYVRNLVAAGDYLDKNPADGLRYLAKQYGIDLQELAQGKTGGEELPPYVRQMQEELARTKQALQSFSGQQEQAQLQHASNWISQFASQKDASGQPKYPHFDECLSEIVVNVQYQRDSGQPIDVHAAYERAVRMNDTVWQRTQFAQAEASRKAAEEKQRRDAEEARSAGFSVSGSGGATSDKPAESIRGELERLLDK